MQYYTIAPPEVLANYVRCYWVLEGKASVDNPYIHRTMASPSPEFIFHYKGPFREIGNCKNVESNFLTGIHAQTDRMRRFAVESDFGIFGVYLQPYAIPALFEIPSSEINNELTDLQDLIGREGIHLTEQVMTAKDNSQRWLLVNQFLERRLKKIERPEVIHAVRIINEHKGIINIKHLVDQISLSQRQFERKFKEHIGFSPKLFSRIVRFDSLLKYYKVKDLNLTQIAYDFGYYDQAHFINEFRQFSGYSPKAYFSGKAKEAFYAP